MGDKKRVAIFRSQLLAISETFIREQASALTAWQPVLVGFHEVEGGLETPSLPRVIVPASSIRLLRLCRFWLSLPDPRLVNCLRRLQVDLVHVHFGTDATDIWPSVKAAGLPMLVTLHGYDINIHKEWWEAGHGGLRRRVYPRRLLRMARDPSVSFIAVSKAIRQRAIDYGIPGNKIAVSYIGVDTERFKPGGLSLSQRRKRILFVGRMVEKKAPLLMIRAFAEVRKQIPDAELTMIGTGPLFDNVKQLAEELKVPVATLGARNSDEVLQQLHEAKIFCLPSVMADNGDAEGLPISILEALACGVPVVTSASGGVDEAVVHNRNGLCFLSNDTQAMSQYIVSLLADDLRIQEFSAAAVEDTFAKFSINITTQILENSVYNSI